MTESFVLTLISRFDGRNLHMRLQMRLDHIIVIIKKNIVKF